jgi:hypothetical protein
MTCASSYFALLGGSGFLKVLQQRRSIRRDEGSGCAAEVVQTHGFPEL